MLYDYSALTGRIVEKYKHRRAFANAIKMSESSLSLKLSNQVYWKQQEIERARVLLQIPIEEVGRYFFTPYVQVS